jgi:hypothetical protein
MFVIVRRTNFICTAVIYVSKKVYIKCALFCLLSNYSFVVNIVEQTEQGPIV